MNARNFWRGQAFRRRKDRSAVHGGPETAGTAAGGLLRRIPHGARSRTGRTEPGGTEPGRTQPDRT
ncbi:hypothetical protein GCM10018793_39120 [Streptomyces sulfonofaciens]|uniref:Uncharacterized protein n=1 Tax=Streptomyces sulfonofaciens TaxID=68272 RepID=A0A919GBG1_9ACTN|nr:hypothetical protein GCM10018793_39120 [Streptomyces sulfonofaciens]